MDRKSLKLPFTEKNTPDWRCPTCCSGVLMFVKNSFVVKEVRKSREAHSHKEWDPEWVEYTYSCMLVCSNNKCNENVASTGVGYMDYNIVSDENGIPWQDYEEFFHPKFFHPPLRIIDIPADCPEKVQQHLEESFQLFFVSPGAASNSVRASIEELLTDLKIKRFVNNKGKRCFISLHQRINLLSEKHERLMDLLLAIKWLGNAGNHGHGSIIMDDVMDAYDIMEHILEELYVQKAVKVRTIAKRINKKRGPSR